LEGYWARLYPDVYSILNVVIPFNSNIISSEGVSVVKVHTRMARRRGKNTFPQKDKERNSS